MDPHPMVATKTQTGDGWGTVNDRERLLTSCELGDSLGKVSSF